MAGDTRIQMKWRLLICLIVAIAGLAPIIALGEETEAEAKIRLEQYRKWAGSHEKHVLARFGKGDLKPKLVMVTLDGEDRVIPGVQPLFGSQISMDYSVLYPSGERWHFSVSDHGSRGGSGDRSLTEAELTRLDILLANLPEDGERLPLPGRRVFLLATVGDRTIRRVYDTANASDIVWETLRLSRNWLRAWMPRFEAEREFQAQRDHNGSQLLYSPDKRRLIFLGGYDPLCIWEPITEELLAEVRRPHFAWNRLVFSPDGKYAVVSTQGQQGPECIVVDAKSLEQKPLVDSAQDIARLVGVTSPQFTSDGRFLLTEVYESALRAFETKSWKQVDLPDSLPKPAERCFLASDDQQAVIIANNEVYLWQAAGHRKVPLLDEKGNAAVGCSAVAFSPDRSLVAIAGGWKNDKEAGARTYIWETATGKLKQRFWRDQLWNNQSAHYLLWSPDGEYLIAGYPGISLWNVTTGRHRGEFTSRNLYGLNGLFFSPDNKQLIAGDTAGKIYSWDFAFALQQIREFEASLPELPAPPRELKNPLLDK